MTSTGGGVELATCPGGDVVAFADRLHAAGATIVAGHHPHVLQPIAARADRVTAYSLGNFVWYHDRPPSAETGILEVEASGGRVLDTTFRPARIGSDGRQLFATFGNSSVQVLGDGADVPWAQHPAFPEVKCGGNDSPARARGV